ncbi:MAG: hypothetical protein ACM3RX_01600 [Methanococcaceae archaeon]
MVDENLELDPVDTMRLEMMDTMDRVETAVTGGAVVMGRIGIADDC